MEDFKEFLYCLVIGFAIVAVLLSVIAGMAYIVEMVELNMLNKKIEILQEKDLITNETMQVLIQDLKL